MRYVYVFSADGQTCHQAHLGYEGEIPISTLASRHPGCVVGVFEALQQPGVLADHLRATIEAGAVVEVAIDPGYTPPEPTPDPVQARLEALEAAVKLQEQAVAANLLATAHDRKWLAQKETAKLVGIPYIQAHPECNQEEVEAAVVAALTAAYPGQAIVVSGPGIIQSYADEALARGYLGEASFPALRDLVAASTPAQVQTMLAVL